MMEDSRLAALQNHATQFLPDWLKAFPKKFTAYRSESLTEW
jgi:hypothetical protein